jgi:hypothetical protein
MRQKTSLIENNGTFYLRIPPHLKDYLNLKVGEKGEPTVVIEDKEKQHGKYAVIWAVEEDEEAKSKK